AERIAAGHWPYARSRPVPYQPNPHAPPFEVLPPPVQELMRRCFEEGHVRSVVRPDAAAWQQALQQAEAEMATCAANAQHVFHPGLTACPWCDLARRQGRDPFPSPEDVRSGRVEARPLGGQTPLPPVAQPPATPRPAAVPVSLPSPVSAGEDAVVLEPLPGHGAPPRAVVPVPPAPVFLPNPPAPPAEPPPLNLP